MERIKELAPQLLPNKDAEIVTYWTNTIDAPVNTLPVNWRRWATPTGRVIPKASKGGMEAGLSPGERLHKKSLQPRSLGQQSRSTRIQRSCVPKRRTAREFPALLGN